jgi:NAD(P)-dependent dehydrogenase (short-subunit alcohol dehydrogenase family)
MKKKIILITGASSGFGWLTAKTCAAAGHKIYAAMRNTTSANAQKALLLSQVENIDVMDVDLTKTRSVSDAVTSIINKEGRIDVLVNNAGVFATGIAETFTEQDMDKVMDVNLKGNWRTMKAVLPHMRRQGEGLIINVSSAGGRFSTPFMSIYNSSKFALEGLTEALHYEVRPLGVDVVLLQPGAFPTEIFNKIISGSDDHVIEGYGDIARVPEQMGAGIMQMFEAVKPNPQFVADAVLQLINTPKGKRPLRTVTDAVTGHLVETANKEVQEQFSYFLSAFGMQGMLN